CSSRCTARRPTSPGSRRPIRPPRSCRPPCCSIISGTRGPPSRCSMRSRPISPSAAPPHDVPRRWARPSLRAWPRAYGSADPASFSPPPEGPPTVSVTAANPLQSNPDPAPASARPRATSQGVPRFGTQFTDHMFVADWSARAGWQDPRVIPYGPLSIDPAASVLHYGQEILEGLKAYAHPDGAVKTFRPYANAARMRRSAGRLALPSVCDELFLGGVDALVRADASWVPTGDEVSLYLRPFMFATEAFVGVRATRRATFAVIASPTGSYFPDGIAPIDVWLSSDHARASAGGTGAAKAGGNYAASLLPQAQAIAHGCDQVVFLDDVEHAFVEESGAMNLFFVYDDGSLVTPASDSILAG